MITSLTRSTFAVLAGVLAVLVGTAALAQGALEVRIREAVLGQDGSTRLVVSVAGSAVGGVLAAENFTVSEQGEQVPSLKVEPLLQSKVLPVLVALVMDISGSTAGKPLADAKSAARTFIGRLPAEVRVALVAFGPAASVRVGFTTDRGRLANVINSLTAGGGTALYDAVVLASKTLNSAPGAQHNIVLFSDGGDTDSRATLAQAINAARSAKAPVTSVGLVTQTFDQNALNQLAAAVKGGRSLRVSQSAQLATAFTQVAQEIASQYVITYTSSRLEPRNLNIAVGVRVGAATATDASTVLNPRTKTPAGGAKPPGELEPRVNRPIVGAFASKTGLYLGIGAVFVAALLFLGMLLYRPGGGRAAQVLQRGLRLYVRSERKREKEKQTGFLGGTAVGRRAVELVEKVPRSQRFEERLQRLLDRAGWPLRSTEFIILQIGGVVVGALFGFGLLARWWLGIVLAVAGGIIPRMVLAQRVEKRQSLFLSQLPDTLQLLAGSLQAGYGFMQAIDTVAKESPQPTSTEFGRVLAETRLGMPVDEALNTMADRVGGADFRWVVLAINIQRQVGGNLAALLTTVADTLREREQVRRQIKVLSAEGRLSAIILVVLPFAIAGYVSLVNPKYLQTLTSATIGKLMIGFALVMIGIGILWMRKIIKIDV